MRRQIIAAALAALSCGALSCSVAHARVPGKCAQLQNAELAIASCKEFLDTHPESASDVAMAWYYRGTALSMNNDRFDEALDDLGKAIEAGPAWPMPYNVRAEIFATKGELAKAIADYDAVVLLSPRHFPAYLSRALAHKKLKDFDHALADLKKVLELKPDDAFTIYTIGEVYEQKGDLKEAETEYRKARELVPQNQQVIDSLKRIGATP
jgi:tetratricopeptide (TPR) repeat protein